MEHVIFISVNSMSSHQYAAQAAAIQRQEQQNALRELEEATRKIIKRRENRMFTRQRTALRAIKKKERAAHNRSRTAAGRRTAVRQTLLGLSRQRPYMNDVALANIKRLQNKFSHMNHRRIKNEPSLNAWMQSGVSGTKKFNANNIAAIARIRAYYQRTKPRPAVPVQYFGGIFTTPAQVQKAAEKAVRSISQWK